MNEVPEGWAVAPIADVVALQDNGKPFQQGWSPQCESRPGDVDEWSVLKTTAIQDGEFLPHENKALPEHLAPRPQIEVKVGDVLMTCAGPRSRCGVACLVTDTRSKLMMSGKMYRFRAHPEALDPRFLSVFLRKHDTQQRIDEMKTGINDSGLNLTHDRFARLPVPVPPLKEQRRIVERIEALFAEIDAGVGSLKAARRALGLYRRSLLKAAFEGRLTAEWRAANPDLLETPDALLARIRAEREARYATAVAEWEEAVVAWEAAGREGRKPGRPRTYDDVGPLDEASVANLSALPCSWGWIAMGEAFGVFVGATPSRKRPDYWGGEVPWVSSGEVQFGTIAETRETITDEGFDAMSGEVHPPGTVMLGMIGEGKTRGQSALLACSATHNQNCAAIRVSETDVPPKFIFEFLRYRYGETRRTGSGNNQPALNKRRVQALPIPLCSPAEQAEIVHILDARLSAADALAVEIDAGLKRADALRQSILTEAFAGRLVPQDPNDEPAADLLTRIRVERDAAPKPTRRRKTKVSA